jgi:hypothetical protein
MGVIHVFIFVSCPSKPSPLFQLYIQKLPLFKKIDTSERNEDRLFPYLYFKMKEMKIIKEGVVGAEKGKRFQVDV